jgi:hypothetical protein
MSRTHAEMDVLIIGTGVVGTAIACRLGGGSASGSDWGSCGAGDGDVPVASREIPRRGHQEARRQPVHFASLLVGSRATAEREQNEADAELEAASGGTRGPNAAEVAVLPWRDPALQAGSRGR